MSRLKELYFKKNKDKEIIYEIAKGMYQNGESITSICNKLNFERHLLSKLLKEDNIEISQNKYIYNENAFKSINTEEDAYWLGFMYADGNINELRMVCDLSMAEKDVEHLEKFKDFISPNNKLIKRKSYLSSTNKEYYSYRFYITNKKITENLIKNGCLWSKTYDVKFPNHISENMMPHFIRGFFDGDGNITKGTRQNSLNFTCANIDFLIDLQNFLSVSCSMKKNKIVKDNRSEARRIQWSSRKDLMNFYNYIYKDATIYLNRKYEIFTQIIGRLELKLLKTQED